MENTIQFQSKKCLDADALLLASIILLDARRIVRNIQAIVAVILHYATMGVSITTSLIQLIAPEEE